MAKPQLAIQREDRAWRLPEERGKQRLILNALASGQDIRVLGTMNASNQLEARYIYTPGF